jgi:hypothetical protein
MMDITTTPRTTREFSSQNTARLGNRCSEGIHTGKVHDARLDSRGALDSSIGNLGVSDCLIKNERSPNARRILTGTKEEAGSCQ